MNTDTTTTTAEAPPVPARSLVCVSEPVPPVCGDCVARRVTCGGGCD